MASLRVVEDLEILEELGARRGRGEEALGHSVIPAIAPAAHTADDLVLHQDPLVGAAVAPTYTLGSSCMQSPSP